MAEVVGEGLNDPRAEEAGSFADDRTKLLTNPLAHELSLEDQTGLILYNPKIIPLSHAVFFAVLIFVYWAFAPTTPRSVMVVWTGLSVAAFLFSLAFNATLLTLRPTTRSLLHRWRAIGKKQTLMFDVLAISMLWLLVPHGTSELQMITVAIIVGYSPMHLITDPENAAVNKISVVAVLGSLVLFLVTRGSSILSAFALVVVLYAGMLLYAAGELRKLLVSALANRQAAALANVSLNRAVSSISSERDATTQFISMASHDLGQPIHAAQLFCDQYARAASEKGKEMAIDGISSSIRAAEDILRQMLHFFRLRADAVDPQMSEFSISCQIENCARRYAALAEKKGIRIVCHGDDKLVRTDASLLDRAIGNLIENALIHSGAQHVTIAHTVDEQRLEIQVTDDGTGVLPADQARIFEDYQQGSHTDRAGIPGCGLGLSSVRRIAILLGGRAYIDPVNFPGARFCLQVRTQTKGAGHEIHSRM